jgi:NADH-quinone oxidoreductase subunit J
MTAINWHSVFFLLFALATCGFALGVVLAENIVRMALYLVMSLGAVAGLFFLAGAEFIGAMQLMVYVGGTLVLLVFGVMLTARGPFVSMRTGGGQWLLALLLGGALLAVLLPTLTKIDAQHGAQPAAPQPAAAANGPTSAELGLGLVGVRNDATAINPSPSGYLLPFEIISVHLLVVLVGAAFLARAKRHRRPGPLGVYDESAETVGTSGQS